ncbi:SOS response-associated peptidase [Variovorax sp. YR752]|uniref:SOS response-associated peptidase n=1 Tax=Variovorax sp. YR752 TaxID=1884383 RepID=UPI000BE37121|nr:SOS response-associated peptidase family protein [Variovorax sp. YR752]
MCTRYISPEDREIEAAWYIGARTADRWLRSMRPLYKGPFMRRARDVTEYERELVVGQWGLIPAFSPSHIPQTKPRKGETKGIRLSTFNARHAGIEKKPAFKDAWANGRRCIIPANSFDEPCWESGRNEWWTFRRTDGRPWGLAGLWANWLDYETEIMWESYTMLTVNANLHPIMSRMHKPEVDKKTKKPLEVQDKRSVVAIEERDFDRWLTCTVEKAREMVQLIPVDLMVAGPAPAEEPREGAQELDGEEEEDLPF